MIVFGEYLDKSLPLIAACFRAFFLAFGMPVGWTTPRSRFPISSSSASSKSGYEEDFRRFRFVNRLGAPRSTSLLSS